MRVTIGTFNLNNLFSRYNFKGEISAIRNDDTEVDTELHYKFGPEDRYRIRSYNGRLVKAKHEKDTEEVANRIKSMDVDVLAVQEVEDIDTLRHFNREFLQKMYPYVCLLEGNDPRLIDVALLSKYPVGGLTSWQNAVHSEDQDNPVFGRDLMEVQVLSESRKKTLFTLYNNHLKSHFVDFRDDPEEGRKANNRRRKRQSEMVAEIIKDRMRPDSRYIMLGDMNDPPDSPYLASFFEDDELGLNNALTNPEETRPAKSEQPPSVDPATSAWTHRFKKSGEPAEHELYDQIWLSTALADKQTGAWIDRRSKHGGDGSDHDPVWVELDL